MGAVIQLTGFRSVTIPGKGSHLPNAGKHNTVFLMNFPGVAITMSNLIYTFISVIY